MFILGFILILFTLLYIDARFVSQLAIVKATMDHVKMSPYHFYDPLDYFLQ